MVSYLFFNSSTSLDNSLIPSINSETSFSYFTALNPSSLVCTNSGKIVSISVE